MITILKYTNQVLAFALELCMLYMLGAWGYETGESNGWKYVLAIGVPAIAIVLWGYYAAPRSDHRLVYPDLSMFKLVLFGSTAFVWYKSGHHTSAIAFFALVLLSEAIAVTFKQ
ncbi:YrdB family protein [Spirosoma fluminis]